MEDRLYYVAIDTGFYLGTKAALNMLRKADKKRKGKNILEEAIPYVISDTLWELYLKDMFYKAYPGEGSQTIWEISKVVYIALFIEFFKMIRMKGKRKIKLASIFENLIAVGGADFIERMVRGDPECSCNGGDKPCECPGNDNGGGGRPLGY